MKFFKMLGLEYFPWTEKLIKKLSHSEYRSEYVAEGVKLWIARQIRTLREQRDWSQSDLAAKMDKKQSAISRLEDPDYGQMTVQTLLELACAYDVALMVKFVDYPTFIRETKDVSASTMQVISFNVAAFALGTANQINIISPHAFSSVRRNLTGINASYVPHAIRLLPVLSTTTALVSSHVH